MKYLISVIIPTYNRANLLSRAIKSVLNQDYQNFELIIIDDGSTDGTDKVVRDFQDKDKRIKYIWQVNSGSPAKPKNTGIKNAKGKFIAFLDSDDEWLAEKLEKQIKLFKISNVSNLGFVGCNAIVIDRKNKNEWEHKITKYKNIFKALLINDFILSSSSMMVKKEVFNKIGIFDEKLSVGEDWDMWIRISRKYDFDFVPEFLFKYYIHNSNITNTLNFEKQMKDIEYIFKKYKRYYEINPKIYSIRLRNDGTKYILWGRTHEGRKYFLKSIKINPFNFKSYIYFILSLFGSKFYYKLTLLKRKLKQI